MGRIRLKAITWMFVVLIISSSLSVMQVNAESIEDENWFGEQETGESIIIEAYDYQPKTGVPVGILEKQDLPVYVFLKATTLGGLIGGENSPEYAPLYGLPEIKLVSAPKISGGDRRFVSGVTFVPSNNKRKTIIDETGRFIDMGYLIVRLKKIEKESDLPGFRNKSFSMDIGNVSDLTKTSFLQTGGGVIDLNVSLDVRFDVENSLFGFGSSDLLLEENANEESWKKGVRLEDSFWNGKGYVRAERIDDKSANLVVYDSGLRRIGSYPLAVGKETGVIPLYAASGGIFGRLVDRFRIKLENIDTAGDKAMLLVNGAYVLRGKEGRIIAGSDWGVDKIVKRKALDNGKSKESVVLKNVKTGDTKTFERIYGAGKAGEIGKEKSDAGKLESGVE